MPPDPKYNSVELARFINKIMKWGKKTTAQRVVYGALGLVEQDSRREALEVFQQALKNATPLLEVRPKESRRCHLSSTHRVTLQSQRGPGHTLDYPRG